ncbi:unnamed protein product [Malus baccata var. baccata]
MDFVYKLPRTQNGYDVFQKALGTRLLYSTTYHPQKDGQSERTIQTLENMLRSSVLQFGDALYGKPCRTPLCWSEVGERVLMGLKIVDETMQNIQVIKANLKAAQDLQKSIAGKHDTHRVYKVGDWVFLKLSPWKGMVRFGKKGKLSPQYIGLYRITERVGEVAYRLKLPPEFSKHVIPPQPLEINLDLTYDEEPGTILDWKDKVIRNKNVHMVKVLWRNHSVEEATWETE